MIKVMAFCSTWFPNRFTSFFSQINRGLIKNQEIWRKKVKELEDRYAFHLPPFPLWGRICCFDLFLLVGGWDLQGTGGWCERSFFSTSIVSCFHEYLLTTCCRMQTWFPLEQVHAAETNLACFRCTTCSESLHSFLSYLYLMNEKLFCFSQGNFIFIIKGRENT